MGVISNISNRAARDKYPYIGIFPDGECVLFYARKSGVSLGGGANKVGGHCGCWDESESDFFVGEITLRQEK